MQGKDASELNSVEQEKEFYENIQRQINGIESLIKQNIISNIPHGKNEQINILGIEYNDYIPLGKVDYKGLNLTVSYERIIENEKGESEAIRENMVFSLDEKGFITGELAKIQENGKIELSDEFEDKIKNAKNGELIRNENENKEYLVKEDGQLKAVDEEEKQNIQDKEEEEKQEILESYEKVYGSPSKEENEEEKHNDILSITEIENPRAIAKVLETPMTQTPGKYKIVRFKNNKFIIVDDKNQIKAGIEVSELMLDLQNELKIRPQDKNPRIQSKDLDYAYSPEDSRYILKIRNPEMDNDQVMITYNFKADSEINVFERDENGNLKQLKTSTKFPPQIVENGKETNLVPKVNNMAELRERQAKLEKALELQKTIEVYEGKSHIVEAASGFTVGVIEGSAVGIMTGNAGVASAAGVARGVQEGANSYRASRADAEETIETCTEQRDAIFKDLNVIDIQEAEMEADEIRKQIGEAEEEYTIYSSRRRP